MRETAWVLVVLLALGAIGVAQTVPWVELMAAGNRLMLAAAMVGVPLEALYFGLLAAALHWNGDAPRGWYWRSFAHHHRLSQRQRWLILPPFYLGALSFLFIVLGIAVVLLAAVAAVASVA